MGGGGGGRRREEGVSISCISIRCYVTLHDVTHMTLPTVGRRNHSAEKTSIATIIDPLDTYSGFRVLSPNTDSNDSALNVNVRKN